MKKVNWFLFTIIITVMAAVVFGQAREISRAEFQKVLENAESQLGNVAYRSERSIEYFEGTPQKGVITKRSLKESVPGNKWRTVEEDIVDGKTTKEERIWDGKAMFVRRGDGPWEKFSGGGSGSARHESGRITNVYRFMGSSLREGETTTLYEVEQNRIANKYSRDAMIKVHYLRKTSYRFTKDGRFASIVEENKIGGRDELSRDVTVFKYDPTMVIIAPIP